MLLSVFPPFGAETGGSRLVIRGAASIAQSGLKCVFEDPRTEKTAMTPSDRVDNDAIACLSPPLSPGEARVHVELHGVVSESHVIYNVTGARSTASSNPIIVWLYGT